jgi:hypothetical protein
MEYDFVVINLEDYLNNIGVRLFLVYNH